MERKMFFKVLLITVMLSIPMIPGITLNGYAGAPEPPTGEEQLAGPQIVGVLTLVHSGDPEDYTVKATFYGFCRGLKYPLKKKLCSYPIFAEFDKMTSEDLVGYRMFAVGPEDCRSECGGEDLIITKVRKFKRPALHKIVAEVELSYVVPVY